MKPARLAQLTHSVCLDSNSSNGDGHRGAFETFGNIYMERSIEDYFYSDSWCFIEWPEKALELLPEGTLMLKIDVKEDGTRLIYSQE